MDASLVLPLNFSFHFEVAVIFARGIDSVADAVRRPNFYPINTTNDAICKPYATRFGVPRVGATTGGSCTFHCQSKLHVGVQCHCGIGVGFNTLI